jgi:hypothetical protein
MWKVRDETHIQIWGDKWVQSTHSNMIQDPARILNQDVTVYEIIDHQANCWNARLIE